MPLLSTPNPTAAEGSLATDVARMKSEPGAYLDLAMLYAIRPDLYTAVGKGYDAFFRSDNSVLTEEERELIAYTVSFLTSSRSARKLHRARLNQLGVAASVLAAIDSREINSFDLNARQKAFLNFARKMASFPHTIVDEDIIYMKQNGFDDAGILEVGALSAYIVMLNTMENAFKVGDQEVLKV